MLGIAVTCSNKQTFIDKIQASREKLCHDGSKLHTENYEDEDDEDVNADEER